MNDYEISKLKKELQRKNELLKEQQEDREYTQKQLVLVQAQRDKYHGELIIVRQKIQNIDKIIAENVRDMKAKLEQQNSDSLNELRQIKEKLRSEQFLNEKLVQQNRNKDATIAQLSARLRQMSKKYKDPSLLVNTKQISEQTMITHNQFYKLTEKYNKLSKDMQNIMAENKILRKLHGVPDNFGFDLEQIKIAQKQQLEDYKAQCRKLQTQIEELQAQRTQLRYRLRQYNTLYSNKGDRFKDMTQQQLDLLDSYALNLKQGKVQLPQIDKSVKEMQREIIKLRAQVQVLQNKAPMQMVPSRTTNDDKGMIQQNKKFQQQIKSVLQPFVQDIKKLSQTNLTSLIQNAQNIQNIQNIQPQNQDIHPNGFKGPIPLPIAHNDWSSIKEGYSFIYSSKIPVDMKDLDADVSFDVMKAKYQVAALQLQNIQSLKLIKEKNKIQAHLTNELLEIKDKFKKCLKVQDQLFIRYFKQKQTVNDKIKKLQIQKHILKNQKDQVSAKLQVMTTSYNTMQKKSEIQKTLSQYTSRLSISQAQVLRLERKYKILSQQQAFLRTSYTSLQQKTLQSEFLLKEKLMQSSLHCSQLSILTNQILNDTKDTVSSDVHKTLLNKMQLMNDRTSNMIGKQTQLRIRLERLEAMERDNHVKDQVVENLRDDGLEVLVELEVVRNRLRAVDLDYRLYMDTFDRLIAYVNQNNISLMTYFKKFDADGSGQLGKKQFQSSLNALGFKMTKTQLDLLFGEFDLDGSHSITYKQFIRKMRRGGAISRSKQQQGVLRLFNAIKHSKLSIRQAFKIIDKDGSNCITKGEMQSAFSTIGIQASSKTVDYIFKMCDIDSDKQISCTELQKLYKDMIHTSQVMDKQIYSEQIDWKLAFILKIQEVSLKFHSNLAQTFKSLDDNGNSVLTIMELIEFAKKADLSIQRSHLQELFQFMDRKKDGKVQFGQFLNLLAEAKRQEKRISRVKYIRERTKQLKQQSQRQIASKHNIQIDVTKSNEVQKQKIRISALETKHLNLLKKNQKLSKQLAIRQQQILQLKKQVHLQQNQKTQNYQKYCQQQMSRLSLQSLLSNSLSQKDSLLLKKQLNEIKIKSMEISTNLELYKGLYQGITDKNKGEELRVGKIEAERNKYYQVVKNLQGNSDLNAEVGKLNIELEYSKRNQEIINKKYDSVIEDLRKIDNQNKKLSSISIQKQKQIISTHVFFQQKSSHLQRQIDNLSLKIIPTITMQKLQQYMLKLRQISVSKSSLQQQNKLIRQKNFNLQVRNDYVQNEKLHIQELQRKLRSTYTDDASKSIIDLTKKLSDYKMSELRAKRELNLLKQKEEYFMRINNANTDNIKELQQELSNWEVKFNQREQFWRNRLSDQMKLMEQFQNQANRAKSQQKSAMQYLSQRRQEQVGIDKKQSQLSSNNYNNVSQFINRPTHEQVDQDNQYTQKLLEQINSLQNELMSKQKQMHQLKASIKQIVPQANLHKLMDFGSQMNVSTNSFVLQTDLSGSQLKNNARRFLNNQKQIQVYYKEENTRITQAAQQSIDTLQRIIDDKNQQLKKKERTVQDLKKQFMLSKQEDCRQIQKLNEQLRQLRAKRQLGSINELMSKTTKNNFYPSKAQNRLQQYQVQLQSKEQQLRQLQDKYDRLLISKSSIQNEKTASKNAQNNIKVQQKLQQLNEERELQKKKFQLKEKQLQEQVENLKKIVNVKTKKIQQLNSCLIDIKNDIVNQKKTLNQTQTQDNLGKFVTNITNGTNKNDAAMEQYMQKAMQKIKDLEGQNRDLKDELGRAKQSMSKTSTKGFKR